MSECAQSTMPCGSTSLVTSRNCTDGSFGRTPIATTLPGTAVPSRSWIVYSTVATSGIASATSLAGNATVTLGERERPTPSACTVYVPAGSAPANFPCASAVNAVVITGLLSAVEIADARTGGTVADDGSADRDRGLAAQRVRLRASRRRRHGR